MMDVGAGGLLRKLVPYALGGFGLSAAVGEVLSVGAEIAFAAFFEQIAPLLGYMPTLIVNLRV